LLELLTLYVIIELYVKLVARCTPTRITQGFVKTRPQRLEHYPT